MKLGSEYLSCLRGGGDVVDSHSRNLSDLVRCTKVRQFRQDLKNTMNTLTAGSAARESQRSDVRKRLPVSVMKFDASKITQFNGF